MTDARQSLDFIFSRRSIRKFTAEPVTAEQLELLQEAALAAPSAMNRQPWRFYFITRPQVIQAIDAAAQNQYRAMGDRGVFERMAQRGSDSLFYGAPLLVIISVDRQELAATGYPLIDAGIAAENNVLAAQVLGLGSCIIGLARAAFSGAGQEQVRQLIQMPSEHEFAISIAIGHPAIGKEPHEILPGRLVRID